MEIDSIMNKPLAEPSTAEASFPDEEQLVLFAKKFASVLEVPLVIWLEGDLGAGKTAFTRALIHALGYTDRVKSPTYGLLELCRLADKQAVHLDLYRISDPGELEFLGLEDLMDERSIVLIEWPDRGGSWLPAADFVFRFSYAGAGRKLHWRALTEPAKRVLSRFEST
jgi:tRNA threonylcarbamoyladenosine biosynthesis protein TsaE